MGQWTFPWNSPPGGSRTPAQPSIDRNVNAATSSTTLSAAAALTGGAVKTVLAMTGTLAAGATGTTDTAANIVAAIPVAQRYVGYTYVLRVINQSSGAFSWTITGGTGVTVTGTATVAQHTWREFIVTLTALGNAPAVSMAEIGTGTDS